MQRNRQFDRAQTGGKVAAAGADALDQEFTQFGSKLGQLAGRQLTQVLGGLDAPERG
jgi:hypothetical protein